MKNTPQDAVCLAQEVINSRRAFTPREKELLRSHGLFTDCEPGVASYPEWLDNLIEYYGVFSYEYNPLELDLNSGLS